MRKSQGIRGPMAGSCVLPLLLFSLAYSILCQCCQERQEAWPGLADGLYEVGCMYRSICRAENASATLYGWVRLRVGASCLCCIQIMCVQCLSRSSR